MKELLDKLPVGAVVLVLAGATAIISAVVCRSALTVREYDLPMAGVQRPFTAVCITDLHGREFGKENGRLLEKIRTQRPDVIFTLGDLIDRGASDEDVARMARFYRELRGIAPVYASLGNHEEDYMNSTGADLRPLIRDAGAIVLDEECRTAEIAGSSICLGGTLGHLFADGREEQAYLRSPEYRTAKQMQDSGLPTVMLSHRPDTILFDRAYENWDIDLFLSGHTHGGLIRLPLIGGFVAPRQGFFPKYARGLFSLGRTRLLVCGGFAGYRCFPRIFNRPEICVLRITPKE